MFVVLGGWRLIDILMVDVTVVESRRCRGLTFCVWARKDPEITPLLGAVPSPLFRADLRCCEFQVDKT